MNHDYAHCADFNSKCPSACFRARLVRDLENIDRRIPVDWMRFRGTDECPRKDEEQNG